MEVGAKEKTLGFRLRTLKIFAVRYGLLLTLGLRYRHELTFVRRKTLRTFAENFLMRASAKTL